MKPRRMGGLLLGVAAVLADGCSRGSAPPPPADRDGATPGGRADGSVPGTGGDGSVPGTDAPLRADVPPGVEAGRPAPDGAAPDGPSPPVRDGSPGDQSASVGGTTGEWTWENPGPQGSSLYDVWTVGPGDVWAVGACGTRSHWNGSAWALETGARRDVWYGLWGTGPTALWRVGARGRIAHFDGRAWTPVASPTEADLTDVRGTGPRDVWAVGADGTIVRWDGTAWRTSGKGEMPLFAVWASGPNDAWAVGGAAEMGAQSGLVMRWNGSTWTRERPAPQVGPPFDVYQPFRNVWGAGPNDVWLVNANGHLLHFNGGVWTRHTDETLALRGIWGRAANDVWVAGSFISHWDGALWSRLPSTTLGPSFEAIHGTDGTNLWLTGADGELWNHNAAGIRRVTSGHFAHHTAVWTSGPDDLWVTAGSGTVVRGDGKSWTAMRDTNPRRAALHAITGTGRNDVWAVGELGQVQRWNGAGWTTLDAAVPNVTLYGAWSAAPDDVWAVGGGGTVVRWNANRWSTIAPSTTRDLRAVHGTGARDVWVVGMSGTLLHWDGAAWTPSPTVTRAHLHSVWASAPNDVWIAGTNGTVRRWNGTSWRALRTGTVATITSIRGRAPDEVWASTDTGLVLRWDGTSWQHTEACVPLTAVAVLGPDDVLGVGRGSAILRRRGKGPGHRPPETSGLDPSRTLASLTDEQRVELCDHAAVAFGGYDTFHTCADGTTVRSRPSQDACVQGFRNRRCEATVAQVEECVRLQSRDDCTSATLEAAACKALLPCAVQ